MPGSTKNLSKRRLSGGKNELEEYFSELNASEPDIYDALQSTPRDVGLSDAEELRRLTAYVAHLRDRVSELQDPQPPLPKRHLPSSAGAIVGFAVIVGVASVLGIIARRLPRFG